MRVKIKSLLIFICILSNLIYVYKNIPTNTSNIPNDIKILNIVSYDKLYKNDDIIAIYVTGETLKSDMYIFNGATNPTIKDLLEICGVTNLANLGTINTNTILKSGVFNIPTKNNNQNLININTASIIELNTLPEIGNKTAQKIIDYRENISKFNSINDIKNVDGVGDKTFFKIKNLITIT